MKCILCDKLIEIKRNPNQKTCSRSCNAIYKNKNRQFNCPKCLICGNNTRRESRAKYCSVSCQKQSLKGKGNPMWKGGRKVSVDGYVYIYKPECEQSHKNGYILEHRYLMSQYIGRALLSTEVVHHKNGNKGDNRIENLELLTSQAEHIFKDGHMNGKRYCVSITTVL